MLEIIIPRKQPYYTAVVNKKNNCCSVWVGHLVDPVVKLWVTQKIWIQLYQYKEFLSLKKIAVRDFIIYWQGGSEILPCWPSHK